MINAPEGTLMKADRINPIVQPKRPKRIESHIILVKLAVYRLAVICGIVNNDINKTTQPNVLSALL